MGSEPRGVYYGWYLVAVCFIINFLVLGISMHSFTVYVGPLEAEFGWTRRAISAAMALGTVGAALAAPLVGRLIDRVGARFVMAAGASLLGVVALLLPRTDSLPYFYALYGIAGVGQSAATVVPISVVISHWFKARRGRALGIVMTGTGLGAMLTVPLTTWIVVNWGWRTSYLVGGCIILSMVPLSLLFVRTRPAEKGLLPDGGIVSEAEPEENEGLTLPEAIRTASFWLIAVMMFLHSLATMGILIHLMPYLTDVGHLAGTAAMVISIYGGMTVIGKIGIGFVTDRVGVRTALAVTYVLLVAGVLLLMGSTTSWVAWLFAVAFGFSAGAPLVINPALTAICLGLRHFGAVFGVLTLVGTIGVGTGAFLTGAIYDTAGSYTPAFALYIFLLLVAALCGFRAREISRRRSPILFSSETPSRAYPEPVE